MRNQLIDTTDWNTLKNNVDAFKPDVVIYLARKMPRMAELLGWDFGDTLAVSDFAIPWIASSIHNKKIAIIDDTVSMGTTLAHVRTMVLACDPALVRTFAVAKKDSANPPHYPFLKETQYARSSIFDTKCYESFSHKLAKALCLQAKPYEIEFPTLTVGYSNTFGVSWEILHHLQEKFGKSNVHYTTSEEFTGTGLARISIDFFPQSHHNYKLRLYLDDQQKRMCIVPMASSYKALPEHTCRDLREYCQSVTQELPSKYETFVGETEFRWKQYMASLEFGLLACQSISKIFQPLPNTPLLDHADAYKLFGPAFAAQLGRITLETAHGWDSSTLTNAPEETCTIPQTECTYLWDILKPEAADHEFLERLKSMLVAFPSRAEYFKLFFEELAQKLGENSITSYCIKTENFRPSKEYVEDNPYLRLRVGATFDDLQHIFEWLWRETNCTLPTGRSLRNEVSSLLDIFIDSGGVVPVITPEGKRAYRKGEAPLYSRNLFSAISILNEHALEHERIHFWELESCPIPQEKKKLIQDALRILDCSN